MRLGELQVQALCQLAQRLGGERASLRLFGSRLDDNARGGDIDLLLELPEAVAEPALLAARFSAQAMRLLDGRKVDVLLIAPNLARLPIHDIAVKDGTVL